MDECAQRCVQQLWVVGSAAAACHTHVHAHTHTHIDTHTTQNHRIPSCQWTWAKPSSWPRRQPTMVWCVCVCVTYIQSFLPLATLFKECLTRLFVSCLFQLCTLYLSQNTHTPTPPTYTHFPSHHSTHTLHTHPPSHLYTHMNSRHPRAPHFLAHGNILHPPPPPNRPTAAPHRSSSLFLK